MIDDTESTVNAMGRVFSKNGKMDPRKSKINGESNDFYCRRADTRDSNRANTLSRPGRPFTPPRIKNMPLTYF